MAASPSYESVSSHLENSPNPVEERKPEPKEEARTGAADQNSPVEVPHNDSHGAAATTEPSSEDSDYGFNRPDMYSDRLVGSVDFYERHLFLCHKNPQSWPSEEFDSLPSRLVATLKQRKNENPRKTRLTICEGRDGMDDSNGDVLVFPDMIRYKGLIDSAVDSFVDDVVVKNTQWLSGNAEPLTGWHIFVCAHASRDKRCGACGPALIKKFNEEIQNQHLKDKVTVRPCSHVGGHKYAGNVIVYGPNPDNEITGHWYGYVTPEDVPLILEQHIGKGKIVDRLWRGQMGLQAEQQQKAQQERMRLNEKAVSEQADNVTAGSQLKNLEGENEASQDRMIGCCKSNSKASCCMSSENGIVDEAENESSKSDDTKTPSESSKGCLGCIKTYIENWEHRHTVTTLAIIGATAAAGTAFALYKRRSS